MKEFYNIKLTHVAGISWWFWTRESFATLNTVTGEVFEEVFTNPDIMWDIRVWLSLIFMIPAMYLLVPTYGAYARKQYVKQSVSNGNPFLLYNKNSIAYFTVLEVLSE